MEVIHENGIFKIESSSQKGKFYVIDPEKPFCNCPQFMYREIKKGGLCKHIVAVHEYMAKHEIIHEKTDTSILLAFLEKSGGSVAVVDALEQFGEKVVNKALEQGELLENKGKLMVIK